MKLLIKLANKSSLLILLFFFFALHLYSIKSDNFYFTVDQGRDALEVRDIIKRHHLPLTGPRTGAIENLFVGPFWYLIITPGYLLSAGHPKGAVWMILIINALVLDTVYRFSRKYLNFSYSFLLTLGLIITNRFWYISQFALNPHLLPAITIGFVLCLTDAFKGKRRGLYLAAFFCGLTIHSELAFVPVISFVFFLTVLFLLVKKRFSRPVILLTIAFFSLFLIPHFIFEITHNFTQTQAILRSFSDPQGIIGQQSFIERFKNINGQFIQLFAADFIPRYKTLGLIILVLSLFIIIKAIINKKLNRTLIRIFFLIITMVFISLVWFSTNKEFLWWHILGLYPLTFIIFMISLAYIRTWFSRMLFFIILFSQILNFITIYPGQTKVSLDQGIFNNQLKAVDWVYKENKNQGFKVYSYLQFVYDFQYQYTIWRQGINQYGYLPCEYSTYPDVPSSLYFSSIDYYQQPKKKCTSIRYLIIEPTKDESGFKTWYQGVTEKTRLLKRENFGKIRVEKRMVNN